MKLCVSPRIPIVVSLLKPFMGIGLALSLGCSVPAAPTQPFAGRNLGGDGECPSSKESKKKTSTKKATGLVDTKKSKGAEEEEEDDSTSEECEDQPSTGNSAGTTPSVNNGIVTPGQALPGTSTLPGTLPTTVTPTTTAPAAAPTYISAIKTYLDQACTSCHNGGFLKPGPNLSNYNDAVKNAASSLTTMKAGTMPKSTKATDAEIKTFEAWIAGGSKQ